MTAAAALPIVSIRPAVTGDVPYVIKTWLQTMRHEFPEMRTGDYFDWQRQRVERVLGDEDTTLHVLHPTNEPEVIWGFAVASFGRVHFVHVRLEHQRHGYARALLQSIVISEPFIATAMTDPVRAWKRKHPEAMRYVPL